MSRTGQASHLPIVVGSLDMALGQRFEAHAHPVHQLAWSEHGALCVTIAKKTWVLPPALALWIPANVVHAVSVRDAARMVSAYFRPRGCKVRFRAPTVVLVSPLLREIVRYLAADVGPPSTRARASALLFELLVPTEAKEMELPMPLDPRAVRIADRLVARPDEPRELPALARIGGASARTVARIFRAETGLSFGQWRTQLRLREAIRHLAAGRTVADIAERVGYASASAFVAAFRRHLGVPPGKYFDRA